MTVVTVAVVTVHRYMDHVRWQLKTVAAWLQIEGKVRSVLLLGPLMRST